MRVLASSLLLTAALAVTSSLGAQNVALVAEHVYTMDSGPQGANSVSPTAQPLPSQAAQPVAPESTVRLPYPFNLMNPADVSEEVWKQARRGQGKPQ